MTQSLPKSRVNFWPSTPRWTGCTAGELCLILVDQVEEAMAHIAARVEKG
jgi:hypothetical protein